MDLKEKVVHIIQEEMGDCVADMKFEGPYQGEDLFVAIQLRYDPEDLEERDTRMRVRVWELSHNVGLVFDWPEEVVAA